MRKFGVAFAAAAALGLSSLVGAGGAGATTEASVAVPATDGTGECPLVVAHRGGYETPPNTNENSMAAFNRAANIGVWAIETDVWFTSDQVPVIMHDETLDRTITGAPPGTKVGDVTYAQLKQYKLNNGEPIPTLDQVLDLIKKRDIWGFIEYKDADDPVLYQKYLNALKGSKAKVYGAGFSTGLMNWLHGQDPKLPLMWFGKRNGTIPVQTTPADVPAGADPGLLNILQSAELVQQMEAAGKKMNVWFNVATGGDNPTGNTKNDGSLAPVPDKGWETMTQYGVHWISTDFPDNYLSWANETDLCKPPMPKESMTDCVMMPKAKKMRTGRTLKVLGSNCMTSADKPVALKVKAKKKVAKKVGKYKVKIKKKGKVTLQWKAPKRGYSSGGASWVSYDKYMKVKKYTIKK